MLPQFSFLKITIVSLTIACASAFLVPNGARSAQGGHAIEECGSCHTDWKDSEQNKETFKPAILLSDQKMCVECHTSTDFEKHFQVSPLPFVETFNKSVHANAPSLSCLDCHTTCYHGFQESVPLSSLRIKKNVPAKCGSCHEEELNAYNESIHGAAMAKNILEAPVCTDCHGEHAILGPSEQGSTVAAQNIPKTCGNCHEKEQMTIRFGIASNRLSTYRESYHGVANRLGEENVANCVSCHQYHDIFSPRDPRSGVYPANLSKTCGQCHKGATAEFLNAKVHVTTSREDSAGAWYVRKFYTYFIGILMLLFLAYVFLDIMHRIHRSRENLQKGR